MEEYRKRHPLMKCGCVAQGYDAKTGKPVCISHVGLHPGATEPVDKEPDLTGRFAYCVYHGKPGDVNTKGRVPSSYSLPFFEYKAGKDYDQYYCGCFGWE